MTTYFQKKAVLRIMSIMVPYFCGHLIGVISILLVLLRGYDPFATQGTLKDDLASHFLFEKYAVGYPYPYGNSPHPSMIVSILALLIIPVLTLLLMRRLALVVLWMKLKKTAPEEMFRLNKIRRALLFNRPKPTLRLAIVCFLAAFIATWGALPVDQLVFEIGEYRFWHSSGIRFGGRYPGPMIGYITPTDLSTIVFACMLIGWFTIIRPARKRLARSKYIAKRWCTSCGYPIADISNTTQDPRCPECGAQRTQG